MKPVREQLCGAAEIERALDAGRLPRLLLVADTPAEAGTLRVVARARALGIEVRHTSDRSLWRLSRSDPAAEVLGLCGPSPDAPLEEVLAATGVVWQLAGLAYPGNTGFAIRLADVSGADGIVIDSDFDHEGRREAVRASMRADRFMPVFWESAATVIPRARAAGRRILAIEDTGKAAPWETDLTTPLFLVMGGERHGVPDDVLALCDDAIRIPMRGFIPSYNVQAAMAMVAGERMRQLGASDAASPDAGR